MIFLQFSTRYYNEIKQHGPTKMLQHTAITLIGSSCKEDDNLFRSMVEMVAK